MRIGLSTLLAAVALILTLFGFATQPGIAPLAIGLIIIVVGLSIFGVIHIGKNEEKGTRVLNGLLIGGTLLLIINSAGALNVPANQLSLPTRESQLPAAGTGNPITAKWVFYPAGREGGTYAASGLVYVLDESFIKATPEESRYNFMKILADGNTGKLLAPGGTAQASSISVSGGAFTKNQLTAKKGSRVAVCGYLDATPAASENVSVCAPITLTDISGGSTPEWMWSFDNGASEFIWRNYAATLWYNSSDAANTKYVEGQATAIEKTFTVYTFPTTNGEMFKDVALYIEAPSANAGAFKKIKISPPSGTAVEYTSLQSTGQMSSSDPRFIAAPALTTSTDTMYYVGKFPLNTGGVEPVRTSNSEKSKYTVEITYDHPASGHVDTYIKAVQNANALTVTGGHFDFATTMNLNMSATASTQWTN